MNTTRHTPGKDEIALLPAFPRLGLECIALVHSAASAREAVAALSDQADWGFDTESKPTFTAGEVSDGPHILQLATLNQAWVFQLHDPDSRNAAARLMADAAHTKAGFGLRDDTLRIQSKLGVDPVGVIELNQRFRALGYRKDIGVKAAVAVMFGQRFIKSKKAATSNWANPRLSESQLVYAANDAWAAAVVHDSLRRAAPDATA